MTDFDSLIKEIIFKWRGQTLSEFAFRKKVIERHILPLIYFHIRKYILKENVIVQIKSFSKKFNQLSKTFEHVYWIILWAIKWIVFLLTKKKEIVVAALGSDRKLSFEYLKHLHQYSLENGFSLISLNVICSNRFLWKNRIFYYPRFLYQRRFHSEIKKFVFDWWNELEKLKEIIQRKIGIEIDFKPVLRFIKDYSRDYYCVMHLADEYIQNLKLLVQDFDYTSNKNIYCEVFKRKKIPTVCLNHSVLIYDHVFESVYSDYALVWGEQQKDRINRLSTFQPKFIELTGNPAQQADKKLEQKNNGIWLYYLPSFENPAVESIFRSVDFTLEFVAKLKRLAEEKFKSELILIPHPNDSRKTLIQAGFKLTPNWKLKNLTGAEIIFFEDGTTAIEALKTNIPLVYLSSKIKSDPYNFEFWKTAEVCYNSSEIEQVINKALSSKIDLRKRKENVEYYLGDANNFYEKFKVNLNKILSIGDWV